jgi:hypothetical protein
VGADATGFDALTSRVKRDAAIMVMQALCSAKGPTVLMPTLEAAHWQRNHQTFVDGCIYATV